MRLNRIVRCSLYEIHVRPTFVTTINDEEQGERHERGAEHGEENREARREMM